MLILECFEVMKAEDITFVKNAIHRPEEPRHFMRVKKVDRTVSASFDGKEIASSTNSLKLQEAGFDLYDPVYYFPIEDLEMDLFDRSDKTTHCPLKGDTEYYHYRNDDQIAENLAWQYTKPFERSELLKGYIAFDQSRVQVVERL